MLGDNGAGKSTFIKILSGVHRHDEGELLVEGEETHFNSPREAKERGHRDGLPGPRDRAADVDLAQLLPRLGADEGLRARCGASTSSSRKRTMREELRKMGIDVRDPDQPVGTLSGGERQAVVDRARRLLRRQGADPRRADVGARRQAVGRRAALRRPGARPRARRHLHHPQPAPRLPGRRPLRDPQPRPAAGRLAQGRDHARRADQARCPAAPSSTRSSTSCGARCRRRRPHERRRRRPLGAPATTGAARAGASASG